MDFYNNSLQSRKITGVNWIGLQTLVYKEVGRFMNVYSQTIVAPMITTLLFYAVFALAFGGVTRQVGDVPYMAFLAPGLIMMTMVQNSFANTSSSMVIAKVQGNIVDILMPPLSANEFYLGFMIGGVLRGLVVGCATAFIIAVTVGLAISNIFIILAFAVLGTMMLSSLGLAGGIWSEKFDHIAAVTNFVVTPLTFLSGTFYSISQLPPFWQNLAHYNPFFYMIDGFRAGFIGHSDGNVLVGLAVLVTANLFLSFLCLRMIKTGYKIKS
jgi:ABC-2 type transport system permease protein